MLKLHFSLNGGVFSNSFWVVDIHIVNDIVFHPIIEWVGKHALMVLNIVFVIMVCTDLHRADIIKYSMIYFVVLIPFQFVPLDLWGISKAMSKLIALAKVAMNMIYSDFYEPTRETGVYAKLTHKFLFDKDGYAPEEKLYKYWKYVAKH